MKRRRNLKEIPFLLDKYSNQSYNDMDKLKFMKKFFAWTAILSAIVFALVGIFSPIEPGMSIFGHILKTIFVWIFVTAILETLAYSFGQIVFHWVDDNKDRYGEHWFVEGIKDDWKWFKENLTWKKVFKVLGIYVIFFLVALGIFTVLGFFVA